MEVTVKKWRGKKPGATVRLPKAQAKAVVALGMAEYKTRALTAAVSAAPATEPVKPATKVAKDEKYTTRALKAK